MSVAIVTGASGLIGSEAVRRFAREGLEVAGLDNDMRKVFFGEEASTAWNRRHLENELRGYVHYDVDIRNAEAVDRIFSRYRGAVSIVVHAAAQPSHDWAAREPFTDFSVNAAGTLTLLEACRRRCPGASFIFCSTNKVYGDRPNRLPLIEHATRWEVDPAHSCAAHGIDEMFGIDETLHSLFGVSKAAADLMVQEYGRYFGLKTACFRGGCLTGPAHSGAELHGFLSYLVRCALEGRCYTIYGYKGKQVRDNIHSADLVEAFWRFMGNPRSGAVYNIGGGRRSNCSLVEAIALVEEAVGVSMRLSYREENRVGDHIWWISDTRRFEQDYPGWSQRHSVAAIIEEIVGAYAGGRRRARRHAL